MALEYTLELCTDLQPRQVLDLLSDPEIHFESRSDRVLGPGVTILAANETELGKEIIKETYQFEPTVYVKFRLDKFDRWELGRQTTIKAALNLLKRTKSDGVLLFNGETPLLTSTSGNVVLNEDTDFWKDPGLLSLARGHYEERKLA